MKKMEKKILALKDLGFLSEGLGLCPKNLQGTSPLTHFVGSAHTRPNRK